MNFAKPYFDFIYTYLLFDINSIFETPPLVAFTLSRCEPVVNSQMCVSLSSLGEVSEWVAIR